MRLILKANGEAGEFRSDGSGGFYSKWAVRGDTLGVGATRYTWDEIFAEQGWASLFRFDGTRLRGWYFNDKGDRPDNIRYYGTKDSTCPEINPQPSQTNVSPAPTSQPSYAGGYINNNNASTNASVSTSNTSASSTTLTNSNSDQKDQIDQDDDSGVINTSDWVADIVGDYKDIIVRNNSRKRTIRITKLLVYDCNNLTRWNCGMHDVNIDLPPGAMSSTIGALGPDDIMTGVKGFSFKYKYWAEFNDPKPFPAPRRKP